MAGGGPGLVPGSLAAALGLNYVANGPEPNGDEGWVEIPFLHPIMVNMYVYLSRPLSHLFCKLSENAKVLLKSEMQLAAH